jgi:putative ATP-dependent endonuclease of OLD family
MLQRTGSGRTAESRAFRALDDAMSLQQRHDLERYLDVNRADMLFARGVVLAEGAGERYLIPMAAKSVGIDLDELGVSICSVEGTDFKPYRLLLNALQIPHVVVTDGDQTRQGDMAGLKRGVALLDSPARESAAALYEASDYDPLYQLLRGHGIFVNQSTLEVEYALAAPDALQHAYDDLVSNPLTRARMTSDLADAGAGDREADKKLTNRIAAQGKGRFAQRAAAHLVGAEHPEYITEAVQWLRTQLAN